MVTKMPILLTLLKSKYTWLLLAGLVAIMIVKAAIGFGQDLQTRLILQAATIATSEALREQCNINIRQQNAEIDLLAAISEVEQMEREMLMEERDDSQRILLSQTEKNRTAARKSLRDHDCPRVGLPADIIRLSDNARAAANQRPAD